MTTQPYDKRSVWGWALYDFANSAYTTLIVTFIFSEFFTRVIAADNVSGTVIWSRAVNISAIIVALSTPVLGAIADFSRDGFKQGYVEGSGANPMLELTRLISASRAFDGTNSMIEGTESSLQNAIRTLGEPGK